MPATGGTPAHLVCLLLDMSEVGATRAALVRSENSLRLALDGGAPGGVEPVDWLHTSTPSVWRSAGGTVRYDWFADEGSDPFDATGDASPPAHED